MTPKPSHTLSRILAFLMLTFLLAITVTQTQARPGSEVPQAAAGAGSAGASAAQAQPSAPQGPAGGEISLHELSFDPLVADLSTTRNATDSAVNSDNQGLFLVQFNAPPNDAQLNALGPDRLRLEPRWAGRNLRHECRRHRPVPVDPISGCATRSGLVI